MIGASSMTARCVGGTGWTAGDIVLFVLIFLTITAVLFVGGVTLFADRRSRRTPLPEG